MPEIRIAPTTQAQLDANLDQARATFQEHRARFPKSFPDAILYKLEETHRDAVDLAGAEPTSFSAVVNGDHAGFVLLRKKKGLGMVYDIGTFPEARQQGVALALLDGALRVAEARKWPILFASVWDGNEASHRLFQSAGFHAQQPLLKKLSAFFPKSHTTTYVRKF